MTTYKGTVLSHIATVLSALLLFKTLVVPVTLALAVVAKPIPEEHITKLRGTKCSTVIRIMIIIGTEETLLAEPHLYIRWNVVCRGSHTS